MNFYTENATAISIGIAAAFCAGVILNQPWWISIAAGIVGFLAGSALVRR